MEGSTDHGTCDIVALKVGDHETFQFIADVFPDGGASGLLCEDVTSEEIGW